MYSASLESYRVCNYRDSPAFRLKFHHDHFVLQHPSRMVRTTHEREQRPPTITSVTPTMTTHRPGPRPLSLESRHTPVLLKSTSFVPTSLKSQGLDPCGMAPPSCAVPGRPDDLADYWPRGPLWSCAMADLPGIASPSSQKNRHAISFGMTYDGLDTFFFFSKHFFSVCEGMYYTASRPGPDDR